MFKIFALCFLAVFAVAAAKPGLVAAPLAYSTSYTAAAYAAPYTAAYASPYYASYASAPYIAASSPYTAAYSTYPYSSILLRR